ncbi:hypothetical protein BDP55DRAFT_639237 [Colletotrichum godetiae]|uniref:Uncharacterized protein n=1 Tax=Colletotrichum godetiae TaxID=1209918 RepID=A0AAJ0A898_9PEZI|nr:uncharacterized protein BDP55DRAFT_639237 [Colletotrichum godetiae]KAK1656891.1 hypothetical protein BDP55DRAFT_639237 [Colletotrichum godetiae]
MFPESFRSFDVVSEWASSMSPHMERARPAPPMTGPQVTFCPSLVSKGRTKHIQPHTNSDRPLSRQSAAGARQASNAAFCNKKCQTGRLEKPARAKIKQDGSIRSLDTCTLIEADGMTEWEGSAEASTPAAEPLQFIRRVDLDGTAAGRSLIGSMLKKFGSVKGDGSTVASADRGWGH